MRLVEEPELSTRVRAGAVAKREATEVWWGERVGPRFTPRKTEEEEEDDDEREVMNGRPASNVVRAGEGRGNNARRVIVMVSRARISQIKR